MFSNFSQNRLLLLIYISTNYAEQNLSPTEQITSNSKITRLSAGLAIKKYWNKYTSLCTTFRHLNSQVYFIMLFISKYFKFVKLFFRIKPIIREEIHKILQNQLYSHQRNSWLNNQAKRVSNQ